MTTDRRALLLWSGVPEGTQPTAAILLVGNELLSAKIRDENAWFIVQVMRRCGVQVREIRTVPDEEEVIADAARALIRRADVVFSSGGVGPTHDDVTLAGIARGTDRLLERHAGMEKILRGHYGDRITPDALRMADLPAGTTLTGEAGWPIMRLDVPTPESARGSTTLYILPGIPSLLRAKVETLESTPGALPRGDSWLLHTVETEHAESAIAEGLREIAAAHPAVDIGSYPRWRADDSGRLQVQVRITVEAPRAAADQVHAVLGHIEAHLAALASR